MRDGEARELKVTLARSRASRADHAPTHNGTGGDVAVQGLRAEGRCKRINRSASEPGTRGNWSMVVRSRPRCCILVASHPRSCKCRVWLSRPPVRADDVPLKPGLCHALARRATLDSTTDVLSCVRQRP